MATTTKPAAAVSICARVPYSKPHSRRGVNITDFIVDVLAPASNRNLAGKPR
jgi:hypothetical protein